MECHDLVYSMVTHKHRLLVSRDVLQKWLRDNFASKVTIYRSVIGGSNSRCKIAKFPCDPTSQ